MTHQRLMEILVGLIAAATIFLSIHFATGPSGGSLGSPEVSPSSRVAVKATSHGSKPATCFDGNWDNDGSAKC